MVNSRVRLFTKNATERILKVLPVNMTKRYFHELTEDDFSRLKINWAQCNEKYPQPPWCEMIDAVDPLGCWGLIFFHVHDNTSYCHECEYFVDKS